MVCELTIIGDLTDLSNIHTTSFSRSLTPLSPSNKPTTTSVQIPRFGNIIPTYILHTGSPLRACCSQDIHGRPVGCTHDTGFASHFLSVLLTKGGHRGAAPRLAASSKAVFLAVQLHRSIFVPRSPRQTWSSAILLNGR